MPPTDRLLEARKTYADLAAASQALRGASESVASLCAELSQLHDELNELAAAVADRHRVLRGASVKLIVLVVIGSFLGALLGSAAAEAWPWLGFGSEPS